MRAVNIKEMEMQKGNDLSDVLNGSACRNAYGGFIPTCMDASDNMSAKMEVMRQLSVKNNTPSQNIGCSLAKAEETIFSGTLHCN